MKTRSLGLMFVGLALAYTSAVLAYDNEDLWLPVSYQELAPELRQAALKAEASDVCHKLLRGGIHGSSEGLDKAVFFLVCWDADRKTFPILVDANTLEFTFLKKPDPVEEDAEQSVPDPQERIDSVWAECQELYAKKTRHMKSLNTLTHGQPVPDVGEQHLEFQIDFDALSLQGESLHYRASCISANIETPTKLTIHGRKKTRF